MNEREALDYALRLLSRRMLAERELERRLLKRASPEVVARVLERVRAWGYVDDRAYAEAFVRARAGRWGERKLYQALRARGVDPEAIEAALEAVQGDPVAEAEHLLRRHAWRHQGDKARAVRYLVRKGYPLEVALEAFERLQAGQGEG